ncbi:MAG: peptide-methionine (R)-S-oxide reductase MsrB [Planctomycetota bacterium]
MNFQFATRAVTLLLVCGGLCWATLPEQPGDAPQSPKMKKVEGTEIVEPAFDPKQKAARLKQLTPIQYNVTQKADTEWAFRNEYWDNKKTGIYRCVVCGLSLFSSDTKYKSGTGWPSFFDTIKEDHIELDVDYDLGYARKEVHCSRCKAHLGHVFSDGPSNTTGLRYCMNSASMKFIDEKDIKRKPTKKAEKDAKEATR